jgi:hypothetical protein
MEKADTSKYSFSAGLFQSQMRKAFLTARIAWLESSQKAEDAFAAVILIRKILNHPAQRSASFRHLTNPLR